VSEEEKEETAEQVSENSIIHIRQGDQKDGYADVQISADGTSAIASFYPPVPGGQFLTYVLFSTRLEDNGITTGVLSEAIQNGILAANTTHTPVRNVIIARSTPPTDEIPEHFIIRKDLLERKPEIDPNLARIDWHSISAFSIVQAKEPIARRIARVDGHPGLTITGTEIPYPVQKMPVFSAGTNVIDHAAGLFAGKSGRISIDSKGTVSIEEVLVLKKGVDFTTGNITFPGDVILNGKIADGFKIYSGGSIVSSEVVDATEIVCKKDMIVQSGIEGKARGAIRVGGNLTAKYIQNCKVAVRGDITVTGSIIQSKIYSMGSIRMGDTGKLVGCECIVIGGIQALDIGSPRGSRTYLRCGTDFTVQQELDIANEQIKLLSIKLQKAEEMYAEDPQTEMEAYINEMRARKAEIANRIPSYLPRIDTNDQAFVEVRGSVYPGTEIEICHISYTVTAIQKQVVFRLDKNRGVIVCEPYKK
jgi:Predicted polymerase, most proteins contain PALM domain, HD hydrolase domain and Zn-ribbon domain